MVLERSFFLKIVQSKSVGNNGMLQAKSANFKGLVFIPNAGKLLLWVLK